MVAAKRAKGKNRRTRYANRDERCDMPENSIRFTQDRVSFPKRKDQEMHLVF